MSTPTPRSGAVSKRYTRILEMIDLATDWMATQPEGYTWTAVINRAASELGAPISEANAIMEAANITLLTTEEDKLAKLIKVRSILAKSEAL